MRAPALLPAFLLLPVLACQREEVKPSLPLPLVRVVSVDAPAGGVLELRGSVAAQSRLKLGFKQGGPLAAVLVREGDRVQKGQCLARQDDVDARSLVRSAGAAVAKARRDAARAERLAGEGALPTSTWDDARTAVEAAEAQLTQAQDLLERTQLLAPAGGTVFARLAEPGETVGAGTPVLVVDSTGDLVVRTGASERDVEALRTGQVVHLAQEGQEGWTEGRVRAVAGSPSPVDGLYAVEVSPGRARLRPGALVSLRFPGRETSAHPTIPLEALVRRQDKDHVFVVEDGRARLREVQVHRSEGRRALIRSGLKPGQRLAAEGAYFLQDGQAVRIAE